MSKEEYLRVYGKDREQVIRETKEELRTAVKQKDKNLAKALFEKLKKAYIGDNIFWANEVGTNIFVATVMGFFCIILIVTAILSEVGVYKFDNDLLIPIINIINAFLILGIGLCICCKGEKHWLKYVLMIMLCMVMGALFACLGFRAVISMSIPVIISSKYMSVSFTRFIAAIAGLFMLGGTMASAYLGVSYDLNFVELKGEVSVLFEQSIQYSLDGNAVDMHGYLVNLLLRSYMPNLLQFALISYICCILAKWGHKAIVDQAETSREFARVDTELSLASNIQSNILPSTFPAYPDRSEFDIYAAMDAAKEVGGDFYDFFLIDENHLALVIADVSDKGVPAALFMMIGKALIKSQLMLGKMPCEVLEAVNNQLCENNEAGLFITAWVGILNLQTGEIVAANAGHEYPAVSANGEYSFIKHKPGVALAVMEEMAYENYNIKLDTNESIYLYTDGVTEATNIDNQQFGKDNILKALNQCSEKNQKTLLLNFRNKLDEFVGTASQHDDITMVGLNYHGIK